MTTSQLDAATWPPAAQTGSADATAASEGPSLGVMLIGVGAILTVGWIGLVAFVAAKLAFF